MTKVKTKLEEAKSVVKNVEEFVTAVAFTVVSIFAVYTGYAHRTENNWYYGLLASGLLVSFQAFKLLLQHFSKKA